MFAKGWWGTKVYFRGPTTSGSEVFEIRDDAFQQTIKAYNVARMSGRIPVIYLAGYSRGGAIAISVANELEKLDIKVVSLILFDAVDRSGLQGVDIVPNNVGECFHAMRDPKVGSRTYFKNCGTTNCHKKYFFGTHGAMGGTPWTNFGNRKIEEISVRLPENIMPTAARIALSTVKEMTTTKVTGTQDQLASKQVLNWIMPFARPSFQINKRPLLPTDRFYA